MFPAQATSTSAHDRFRFLRIPHHTRHGDKFGFYPVLLSNFTRVRQTYCTVSTARSAIRDGSFIVWQGSPPHSAVHRQAGRPSAVRADCGIFRSQTPSHGDRFSVGKSRPRPNVLMVPPPLTEKSAHERSAFAVHETCTFRS